MCVLGGGIDLRKTYSLKRELARGPAVFEESDTRDDAFSQSWAKYPEWEEENPSS